MGKIIFLNSHPIQYFVPLYQKITTENNSIEVEVVYCSGENNRDGNEDIGFGTTVKWDIPLLHGYKSIFLKNYSWFSSIDFGFWSLLNFGIIKYLFKNRKAIIVIHGWAYATNILAILFGRLFGLNICLRAETPLNQELRKNKFFIYLKHKCLKCLFYFVEYFLFIGNQNYLFYKKFGIAESKLIFVPYCVDNNRFKETARNVNKTELKELLFGIPPSYKIIMFSGKYIEKKRPLDLIKAFLLLNRNDVMLVMIGEGELRSVLEKYISIHNLKNKVKLTGFVNQTEIPKYYSLANVFVMCSGLGETWGLSVNEAMNFGTPIIVSDTSGCSNDLVKHGENGYVFREGNIEELSLRLSLCLDMNDEKLQIAKECNNSILNSYSYDTIINSLKKIVSMSN